MTKSKICKNCRHNQYDHHYKTLHSNYVMVKRWYGACQFALCPCELFEEGGIHLATQ